MVMCEKYGSALEYGISVRNYNVSFPAKVDFHKAIDMRIMWIITMKKNINSTKFIGMISIKHILRQNPGLKGACANVAILVGKKENRKNF